MCTAPSQSGAWNQAILALLDAVDDDVAGLSDVTCGGGEAQLFGHVEQPLRALQLHALVHLVGKTRAERPLLTGVGEDRGVVELELLDEVEELVGLLLGLAGKAHEPRRPEDHAGNLLPEPGEELAELRR